MSASLGRFLIIDQALLPALFNALINGGIAWWLNRAFADLVFLGGHGIAVDFLATAFLLPLISCLIVTPLVVRQVVKGKLAALDPTRSSEAWLGSSSVVLRSLLAGLVGIIVTLPILLAWWWAGPVTVSLAEFVGIKTVFAAVLGGCITPLIAWWALIDASRSGVVLKEIKSGRS